MTTTTKKKAYKFIVRGVYRGTDGRDKAKKFFEAEEFILPAHYTYPCGRKEVDKMKSDAEGKPMKVKTSVPLIKTEHILRCYKTVLKNYYLQPRLREKYPDVDKRLSVRPGITGLAQIRNGYDTGTRSFYRKLKCDLEYIARRCWSLEFFILFRTLGKFRDRSAH